jgi:hypothetical protein
MLPQLEKITQKDKFFAGVPFILFSDPDTIYKYMPTPADASEAILLDKKAKHKKLRGYSFVYNISSSGFEIKTDAYVGGPTFHTEIEFLSLEFVAAPEQELYIQAISSCIFSVMTIF